MAWTQRCLASCCPSEPAVSGTFSPPGSPLCGRPRPRPGPCFRQMPRRPPAAPTPKSATAEPPARAAAPVVDDDEEVGLALPLAGGTSRLEGLRGAPGDEPRGGGVFGAGVEGAQAPEVPLTAAPEPQAAAPPPSRAASCAASRAARLLPGRGVAQAPNRGSAAGSEGCWGVMRGVLAMGIAAAAKAATAADAPWGIASPTPQSQCPSQCGSRAPLAQHTPSGGAGFAPGPEAGCGCPCTCSAPALHGLRQVVVPLCRSTPPCIRMRVRGVPGRWRGHTKKSVCPPGSSGCCGLIAARSARPEIGAGT
mmetsp:Transcript_83390/g.169132  ORF Transcript_83390/g.169132 Transcript_83390/m.169132 type:complete len:308 (-) Transcript_83390:25-948(-)